MAPEKRDLRAGLTRSYQMPSCEYKMNSHIVENVGAAISKISVAISYARVDIRLGAPRGGHTTLLCMELNHWALGAQSLLA